MVVSREEFNMKLGIIGSGMIVYDLLTFIDIIDEIELTAILGRKESQEKIETLINKHHIKKAYYDYDELLNDDEIDTIYVALPNHLHYEYTKKALLHNKHVICEKPFTSNVNELDELIALAKQQNCLLFEAITNQYLPTFKEIKEKISEIGKISIISSNYSQYSSRYNAFKRGEILPAFDVNKSGGALMDLNVYNIHFVVGLFGAPNKVEYFANIEKGIDTSGVAILEYPTFKAICIGAKDCSADIKSTIQGNKGSIAVLGPTNSMPELSLALNGQSMTMINENSLNHRMQDEFVAFQAIIEHQDMTAMKLALEHSRLVMEVLEAAVNSL